MSLDRTHFDVCLLGTDLPQSVLAAALARAGASVLHVDEADHYGGRYASLSLSELSAWRRRRGRQQRRRRPPPGAIGGGVRDAASSHVHLSFPAFGSAGQGRKDGDDDDDDDIEGERGEGRERKRGVAEPPLPEPLARLDRHYSLSLLPALVPCQGATIDTLLASKVASYCTFRLLEHTSVVASTHRRHDGASSDVDTATTGAGAGTTTTTTTSPPGLSMRRVPSSKQDVFKDRTIGLADKRRLMRLLLQLSAANPATDARGTDGGASQLSQADAEKPLLEYLAERHQLAPHLAEAIAYGVCLCTTSRDATGPALERARHHLGSIGRYGNAAYLVGQYGGAGELAQSFCRASAVYGGTYILGHTLRRLERAPSAVAASDNDGTARTAGGASVAGQERSGGEPNIAAAAKAAANAEPNPRLGRSGVRWEMELQGVDEPLTAEWLVGDAESLRRHGVGGAERNAAAAAGAATIARPPGEDDQGERRVLLTGILVLDRAPRLDGGERGAADEARDEAPAARGGAPSAPSSSSSSSSSDATAAAATADAAPPETALLIFPPGSLADDGVEGRRRDARGAETRARGGALGHTSTSALVMGEGTFSCPKGQYVVYLSAVVRRKDLITVEAAGGGGGETTRAALRPAVDAVLRLASASPREWSPAAAAAAETPIAADAGRVEPLLECYFCDPLAAPPPPESESRADGLEGCLSVHFPPAASTSSPRPSPPPPLLATVLDEACAEARRLFYRLAPRDETEADGERGEAAAVARAERRVEELRTLRERIRGGRRRRRAAAEFRGRGGVGPEHLERATRSAGSDATTGARGEGPGAGEEPQMRDQDEARLALLEATTLEFFGPASTERDGADGDGDEEDDDEA